MNKNTPIKRHAALVPLSKDHHFGLLLSWKIRQGIKHQIETERICRYIIYFFDQDLQHHFREEESLLFAFFPEEEAIQQAVKEHGEIRRMVNDFRIQHTDKEALETFADLLERHIRFEERTLFNRLQDLLTPEHILKLQSAELFVRKDIDAEWNDHFWLT